MHVINVCVFILFFSTSLSVMSPSMYVGPSQHEVRMYYVCISMHVYLLCMYVRMLYLNTNSVNVCIHTCMHNMIIQLFVLAGWSDTPIVVYFSCSLSLVSECFQTGAHWSGEQLSYITGCQTV